MTDTKTTNLPVIPDKPGELLARVNQVEALWDDLDDLDLVPAGAGSGVPFIKTNGNIDGGLFLDGEHVDEVLCVIPSRSISRSKFDKTWDEDKTARPTCWSSNGTVPDEGVPDKRSDLCATCPVSYEHATDRKTACKRNLELLAYVPDTNDIRIMRFRIGGISFKHAMNYWASFRTRIPKKHPVGYITKVTMVAEETSNGNKLAAHFERYRELERDEVAIFIADARSRKAMWQAMVSEDITEASAQPVETERSETNEPFGDEGAAQDLDGAPF